MKAANRNLTESLNRANEAARQGIIQGSALSRKDRELLTAHAFLMEVIKGWYILTTPDATKSDPTLWQGFFWPFCMTYLGERFGEDYCLSAESSLGLWTGSSALPRQITIMTRSGGNGTVCLPDERSLVTYEDAKNLPRATVVKQGIRIMPLAQSLLRVSTSFYTQTPSDAEIALHTVRPDDLSRAILGTNANMVATGRVLGGLRACGQVAKADRITIDLQTVGMRPVETNPFLTPPHLKSDILLSSPYVARIKGMWAQMRNEVATAFPPPPLTAPDPATVLANINEIYVHDAYNSLSIEGYHVTPEMIERISKDDWSPESKSGQAQKNAMAAHGYWRAHQEVTAGINGVLSNGRDSAQVFRDNLQNWYRALVTPFVQAGLLKPADLAGYRDRRIFIRSADHVPPSHEVVPELMDTLFDLLTEEPNPAVRGVLGHFCFVYIHPYQDGNGRIGRFLLNHFFASAGYPWTVIRKSSDPKIDNSDTRTAYMSALNQASYLGKIAPLASFVRKEMDADGN